jgi:hypothetical protein
LDLLQVFRCDAKGYMPLAVPMAPLTALAGSVVAMDWSPKLNQLFVGTSTGKVHCLYDPVMSNKGIMLGLAKTPRKADPGDQFQCVHARNTNLPVAVADVQ